MIVTRELDVYDAILLHTCRTVHLPFCRHSAEGGHAVQHVVRDVSPIRCQTYGYLLSHTALPLSLGRPPVLISYPAEGRRLSWPEWLVTHHDGISHPSQY